MSKKNTGAENAADPKKSTGAENAAEGSSVVDFNKTYEEFKVSPVYKDVTDETGRKIGTKLTGFSKDSDKAIRKTRISEDKAKELNSQSENTGVRLYEVGAKDE